MNTTSSRFRLLARHRLSAMGGMHTAPRTNLARRVATAVAGAVVVAAGLTTSFDVGPASAAADPGWLSWVGPSIDDLGTWVRTFATTGTTMYAGTEGDGVFRSTDGGITWSKFSNDLPAASASVRDIEAGVSEVLIATDGGVWRSTGGNWARHGQGEGANKLNLPVQTLYKTPTALLAGAVGGAFRSADGGATWADSSTGLPIGTTVWSIDGYSYLPGYLFAATSNGAFVSLNGGTSWSAVTNGLPTGTNVTKIVADQLNPGTWYAITSGAGVFRTQTGGLLWEPVNTGLPTTQIRSILLLPIDAKSALVIGTSVGVFTSFDKGATWNPISNGGLDGHTSIWALTTTPAPLALVAGAQGGGVRYRVMSPPVNLALPAVSPSTGLNVGEVVTTSTGTWEGTDVISYTYQWQRCFAANSGCSDITDATLASYTLAPADQGRYIRSAVTAHNPVDLPESLTTATSVTTAIVSASPSTLPGATIRNNPTISVPPGPDGNTGTIFSGETLTALANTWLPAATSYAFQWFRCSTTSDTTCEAIAGYGGPSYALTGADTDMYIRVKAKGTNSNGIAESDLGPTVGPILPKQVTSTTPPAVVGKAWAGATLTRSIGSYSGPIETAYTTWQVCPDTSGSGCFPEKSGHVGTAGIAALALNAGHLGKYIRVKVEVDVNDASAPQPVVFYSAFSAKVAAAPPKVTNSVKPKILGVPATGVVLQIANGTWGGAPTFTYQWLRCSSAGTSCGAIAGATTTKYTVTSASVGKTIRVEVRAVNAWGIPLIVRTAATPVTTSALKPVYINGAAVTGTRKVGGVLKCARGLWSASPAATYTYKWTRSGTTIAGATSTNYTLKAADKTKTVACVIRASNSKGATAKAVSAGVIS